MKTIKTILLTVLIFTSNYVLGQGHWYPQNPAPLVIDIIDLEIINQQTAIVINDHGLILKTTNEGISWDTLFYNDDPIFSFKKIFVTDEEHAWAIGDIVIYTQNGGLNWYQCPTYLDMVNDLFFINLDTGFLVGKEGNKAMVLKTMNGGQSWTAVLSDSTLWSAFSIFFLNENTGYVGGYGKVFKTNDGGLNWYDTEAPINGYTVDNLHFSDSSSGIIASVSGKIAKTLNGGISWEMCTEPKMDIRSIYCQDNDHLWLSGNKSSSWEGIVKYTSDGGISWDSIVMEYSTSINAIDFKDNSGWYGGTLGTLYHTKNGGVDWGQISGSITSASLQAIHFINPNMGWISGWSPHILLKTIDGGKNWEEIHGFGESYMNDLFFTDEENGWGCMGNSLYKTENGGLNWDSVFSDPEYGIGSFQVVNQNTIFISNYSILYRSTDGGDNWEEVTIVDSAAHYSNLYFYENHGWITIGQGSWWTYESNVYKSDDGGMSWYLLGESNDYDNFYFINQDTGFGVGSYFDPWTGYGGTYIDKTIDGGLTWNTTFSTGGLYSFGTIISIDFADELHGWALSNGAAIITTDGGESWEFHEDLPNKGKDLIFVNSDCGWIIDDYMIWKYEDGGMTGLIDEQFFRQEETMLAYPNPSIGMCNLRYKITQSGMVNIKVLNLQGKLIQSYSSGNQVLGEHILKIDLSSQPDGLYFIRLQTGEQVETAKVLLIK